VSIVSPRAKILLNRLFQDWQNNLRNTSAPDKRIKHHDRPPDNAVMGDLQRLYQPESRVAQPIEYIHKQNEMGYAQRQIGKKKRRYAFHFISSFAV
jgi:hypothetical protein